MAKLKREKNKKSKSNKNKSSFTLIELLIVIGIIGLLASVILIRNNSRERSRDAVMLSMMDDTRVGAYLCLDANVPTYRITNPGHCAICNPAPFPVCEDTAGGAVLGMFWPDMSKAKGWVYGDDGDNFVFCAPGYSGSGHPTTFIKEYSPGSPYEPKKGVDSYCYMMCNSNCSSYPVTATKWIWCTEDGCKKEGF